MKCKSFAIIAALACTSTPFAIGMASDQPAAASASSAQLDRFVWDGICTGQITAMGKTPGRATTGIYHGEKTLDGHWVVIHYAEDQTVANPKPFDVVQYIGYDRARKHFVSVIFTNTSASYGPGVSSGWNGNAITFDESDVEGGKRVFFRDSFTISESGGSHAGWMRDKHGKWRKTEEETCHKT